MEGKAPPMAGFIDRELVRPKLKQADTRVYGAAKLRECRINTNVMDDNEIRIRPATAPAL